MQETRPKVVVLENVNTLVNHQGGKTLRRILKEIDSIRDTQGNPGLYDVRYQILNSLDYGIPQNRRRVYFVCIRRDLLRKHHPFQFPEADRGRMKSVHSMVDNSDQKRDPWNRKDSLDDLPKGSAFVNLNYLRTTNHPSSHKYCSTMLTQNTLWCVPHHRRANIVEHLRLQGFPESYKQVVRKSHLKRMLGNSMTVDVLVALFEQVLPYLRPRKKKPAPRKSKKKTKAKRSTRK
jgi:DNA (cytosine-5)-methyltransferase 1